MTSLNKTTSALRTFGVSALGLSALHFMVGGRYDLNSLTSYYLFLGLNLVLCLLGILSSKFLHENKTARTFLGTSLALVPVQLAQLGAFIFSRLYGVSSGVPEIVRFDLPSSSGLSFIIGVTLVFLIPITYLGFSIFNRNYRLQFTSLYLVSALTILLPFRSGWVANGLLVGLFGMAMYVLFRCIALKTKESKISQTILFIPFSIYLGRMMMHTQDAVFFFVVFCLIGGAIFFLASRVFECPKNAAAVQGSSILFFLIGFMAFAKNTNLMLMFTLFILLVALLGYKSLGSGRGYRLAASVFAYPYVFACLVESDYTVMGLIIPMVLLAGSIYHKEKQALVSNTILFLMSTGCQVFRVIDFELINSWKTLAVGGIILIGVSGFMERNFQNLKIRLGRFQQQLK